MNQVRRDACLGEDMGGSLRRLPECAELQGAVRRCSQRIFMANGTAMLIDVAGYHSQLSFYRPYTVLADGSRVRMEWGISFIPYKEVKLIGAVVLRSPSPRVPATPKLPGNSSSVCRAPEVQISWTPRHLRSSHQQGCRLRSRVDG
jgi:hypothetical protein